MIRAAAAALLLLAAVLWSCPAKAQTTLPACNVNSSSYGGWPTGCDTQTVLQNIGWPGAVCDGTYEHTGVLTLNGQPVTGDATRLIVGLSLQVHVTGFMLHYAKVYTATSDGAGGYVPQQFITAFGYNVMDEQKHWPAPMGKPLAKPFPSGQYLIVVYKCASTQPNGSDQVWFDVENIQTTAAATNTTQCPNVVNEADGSIDYGSYSHPQGVTPDGAYQYGMFGPEVTYASMSVPAGWTPHCAFYDMGIVNAATQVISYWWNPAPYDQLTLGVEYIASTFMPGAGTPGQYLYGMMGCCYDPGAHFPANGNHGAYNVAGGGVQKLVNSPAHRDDHYYLLAPGLSTGGTPITGDYPELMLIYYVMQDQAPLAP